MTDTLNTESSRPGISKAGDESERIFRELLVDVTVPSKGAALGDIRMVVDDKAYYVEIKRCESTKGGTLNQIRALKYIPLVVHLPKQEPSWMVIPPNRIVELVASRSRGQHTEIPFESVALSVTAQLNEFRCAESELEAKVEASIREGQKYSLLHQCMADLKRDIQRLNAHAKMDVQAIMSGTFEHFHRG